MVFAAAVGLDVEAVAAGQLQVNGVCVKRIVVAVKHHKSGRYRHRLCVIELEVILIFPGLNGECFRPPSAAAVGGRELVALVHFGKMVFAATVGLDAEVITAGQLQADRVCAKWIAVAVEYHKHRRYSRRSHVIELEIIFFLSGLGHKGFRLAGSASIGGSELRPFVHRGQLVLSIGIGIHLPTVTAGQLQANRVCVEWVAVAVEHHEHRGHLHRLWLGYVEDIVFLPQGYRKDNILLAVGNINMHTRTNYQLVQRLQAVGSGRHHIGIP